MSLLASESAIESSRLRARGCEARLDAPDGGACGDEPVGRFKSRCWCRIAHRRVALLCSRHLWEGRTGLGGCAACWSAGYPCQRAILREVT